jgi:hypothetical protein
MLWVGGHLKIHHYHRRINIKSSYHQGRTYYEGGTSDFLLHAGSQYLIASLQQQCWIQGGK